jgi:predicted nucleotidyltransferase
MADPAIIAVVRGYLQAVKRAGFDVRRGVLYGSQARGDARKYSDIDLVVISREFDSTHDQDLVRKLWMLCAHTDARIEPVPCGEQEWITNDTRILIEIARREGIEISIT